MSIRREQILMLNALEEKVRKQIYSSPTEQQFITLISLFREHLEEHQEEEERRATAVAEAVKKLDELRDG